MCVLVVSVVVGKPAPWELVENLLLPIGHGYTGLKDV
jgi:hypothetical protein